ncbi:MAG: hypothetical protein ACOYOK_16315, partial [Pseudobdellovibrionaceae bacterium]
EELIDNGLGDAKKLENLDTATAQGYYFPSKKNYYDRSVQILIKYNLIPADMTSKEYLQLPAQTRKIGIDEVLNNPRFTKNIEILSALMLLEDQILYKIKFEVSSKAFFKITELMQEEQKSTKSDQPNKFIKMAKTAISLFKSPAYLLPPGSSRYGLPSQQEVAKIDGNIDLKSKIDEINQNQKGFLQKIDLYSDQEDLNQIKITEDNYNNLVTRFRSFLTLNIDKIK